MSAPRPTCRVLDVVADVGLDVGADDDDDAVEAGRHGRHGHGEVEDGLALGTDPGQLLHTAEAAAETGGHDDKRWIHAT